jgi:hypothetical protein
MIQFDRVDVAPIYKRMLDLPHTCSVYIGRISPSRAGIKMRSKRQKTLHKVDIKPREPDDHKSQREDEL